MKKTSALIFALLITLLLSSCSDKTDNAADSVVGADGDTVIQYELGDESSYEYTTLDAEEYDYMSNDLTQFVKLGQYTGLTVTKESAVLTDEEFENEIDSLLEDYSTTEEITDRAVTEGDIVCADYAGYRDGVTFDGGTATYQTITAQSGTGYIDGFAEAFIGQLPGIPFEFDVTFPESYGNTELAGVTVTFKCTVHYIYGEYETPELTDEFVNEKFGYNNVEEFRILYRESVEKQKAYYIESQVYSDLWSQITDNATIMKYPEEEVKRIYENYRNMYEQYASSYGVDYSTFLSSYVGMTDDDLFENSRSYVKEDLVMYQLIKDLDVSLSDDEKEEGLQFFADYYGMSVDELTSYYGEDTIVTTVLWQKLLKAIAEDCTIIEE